MEDEMVNATRTDRWPMVMNDRCEVNLPGVGELWNAVTALALVLAGMIPLVTSTYSDEEVDLVNALVTLNGVTSALSHSTLLRLFGRADALSMNLCSLLAMKALVTAHSPWLFAAPRR